MRHIAGKLAEMDEFVSAAPEVLMPRIRQPLLRRLLADWVAQGNDGRLPSRAAFAPETLRYLLGNLILWDIAGDPPRATCRLFGANLVSQRGFDLTGKTPEDHPDPAIGSLTGFAIRRILAERQPVLTRGQHALADGTVVLIETVSLPLAGDGVTIDMLLHGQINERLNHDEAEARRPDIRMACDVPARLLPKIAEPRLRLLLQDWDGWRGGRSLPDRRQVTPENLRPLLGNLFLFDIEQGETGPRFRYRLFGSNVAAYRGFDLTGRCIDEHPDAAFAARAQLAYCQAVAARQPLWACVDAVSPDGLLARFEGLILPLAADGETPDMVLAAQIMAEPGAD